MARDRGSASGGIGWRFRAIGGFERSNLKLGKRAAARRCAPRFALTNEGILEAGAGAADFLALNIRNREIFVSLFLSNPLRHLADTGWKPRNC